MAILHVIRGLNPGQQFVLEGDRAVLGRHPDCDIVVDVGAVSRQHAQITHEDSSFFVEDLKSRNGTYVNGQMIQGRQKLQENDRLRICDVLFTFHHGNAPSASILSGSVSDEPSPSLTGTMLFDDAQHSGTTIMSTLDVQTNRGGALNVNAEAKLKAFMEIARDLRSTLSLELVLRKVLDSLFKIFIQADRGFVVLLNNENVLVPMAVRHRRPEAEDTIRVSRTVVNQAMTSREAILSADAATDSRFDSSQSIADFRIRSMMCVPLLSSSHTALGVIQVDTLDQRARFQKEDLELLAHVALQAATAVENAQLHEAALKKQALERDLDLAHKVQQGILPHEPPKAEGYAFFDYYVPANQVGGDYFDYIALPNRRIGIVLADVSGKGVSAALLMARLSSETRYVLASQSSTAEAMTRLNDSFARGGWEDRFVTMILAIIDMNQHTVTITNAGHMAPLIRYEDGRVAAIGDPQTGLPLGVSEGYEYEEFTVPLAPGDSLTIFTDGFSEAMNTANELYGLERLEAKLSEPCTDVRQLGSTILADVQQFVGKRAQSDDMCLICFGRNR